MPNQQEILAKLEHLDNTALQDMIQTVATALGMSGFKARMLAANPEKIRRKLEQSTPTDFSNLLASLDEATLASLLAQLNANS